MIKKSYYKKISITLCLIFLQTLFPYNLFANNGGYTTVEATSYGVGIPLAASSPVVAAFGSKASINMAIDATLQYTFTGTVDIADVGFAGLTSPAISPLFGSLVDVNAYGVNVYGVHGNKKFKDVFIEAGFGYIGYGLKRYGNALGNSPYIDEFAAGLYSVGFQSWIRNQNK